MERIAFHPQATVIDYGCGIGRLAARLPNTVIGVDISRSMRSLSTMTVDSDRFCAIHPATLREMTNLGFRANGAIAAWFLQHALRPGDDIATLASALSSGSALYVLNRIERFVPTVDAGNHVWVDDRQSIPDLLDRWFRHVTTLPMPETLCERGAYFSHYVRR
jgi:SAM-dependent methyltransferase